MAEVSAPAKENPAKGWGKKVAGNVLAETTGCANTSPEAAFGEAAI